MSNKRAFTLIEILIVVAVFGILAVVFLPSLTRSGARARDAKRMADVRLIVDFLTDQYIYTGKAMPTNQTFSCISTASTASQIGGQIGSQIAYFGGNFPVDPQLNNCWPFNRCCGKYLYYKGLNCTTVSPSTPPVFPFIVMAKLENSSRGNLASNVAGINLTKCGPTAGNEFITNGAVFGVLGSR